MSSFLINAVDRFFLRAYMSDISCKKKLEAQGKMKSMVFSITSTDSFYMTSFIHAENGTQDPRGIKGARV